MKHDPLCHTVGEPRSCKSCELIRQVRHDERVRSNTLALAYLHAWTSSGNSPTTDLITRKSLIASDAACSDPLLIEITNALMIERRRSLHDAAVAVDHAIRETLDAEWDTDALVRMLERLPVAAEKGIIDG